MPDLPDGTDADPQPAAPTPSTDNNLPRHFRKLLAAGLAALTGGGSVLLHYLGTTSSALGRYAAAALLIVSVATAARVALHLKLRYFWHRLSAEHPDWTGKRRFCLTALVMLNVLVAVTAGVGGYRFYVHPDSDLAVGLLFVLAVTIALSSTATIKLARHTRLPRGSDTIRTCPAAVWLEEFSGFWDSFPGVKALIRLLTNNTKQNEVSRLVMVLVAILWVAALIQAPIAVPDFFHWIKPGKSAQIQVHAPKPIKTHEVKHQEKIGPAHAAHSTQTSPAPSPQPVAETPSGHPTYEELCGTGISPGDGIPPNSSAQLLKESSELNYVWLLNGGVIAGCATIATPLFDAPAVYYILGECGASYRSLAIVSPEHSAAIVLDPLANFAKELVEHDLLVGASVRENIGTEGDFQVLYSTRGPFIGIRDRKTDGRGGPHGIPRTCAELSPAKIKDVILEPGMTKLWLRLGEAGKHTWPTRNTSRAQAGTTFYSFYDAEEPGTTVATGSCSGPDRCYLTSAEGTWRSEAISTKPVTAARVKELGPVS